MGRLEQLARVDTNPLTLVSDALWRLLENHAPLRAMIQIANRIKFTGMDPSQPLKAEAASNDFPELGIKPSAFDPQLGRTSSGSYLGVTFTVWIASGAPMADDAVLPVVWETYRAMAKWRDVLAALTWKDKAFVMLADPETRSGTFDLSDSEDEKGTYGWVAVWKCRVDLWFTTADLIAAD